MRLSWNEIRARAARFAEDWKDAAYEKGETQSFYNDFFNVFGVQRRTVASYEQHVNMLDNQHGFIDLFWRGVLLVEQKSAGRDLIAARNQAMAYFDAIPERDRPRYILTSDFQSFELLDLDEREEARFTLSEFPEHVDKFGFILGVQPVSFRDQDPANVEASELVGRLHDELAETGYSGHDLERFLVRIVFCLFGDDTGIFEPRDIFLDFIESRTSPDGADLGPWLAQIFQILNTPENKRLAILDEDLARFPYVNGELFKDQLRIPAFNSEMRETLLECCRFNWSGISPAIFGALFQSVLDRKERREQGAHYTTEKNILKVIQPLFLDDLRTEFERIRSRKTGRASALRTFQEKLSGLKFFDPACGCGNFLIIAYRELRLLELDVLKELHAAERDAGARVLDVGLLSKVNVDQFYGIEIGEFPVRIAETAMWMMDHIMNNRLSLEFGEAYSRIPLEVSPTIKCADALEVNWAELLPPEECSYVFGNPPFVGAKFQSKAQRNQVKRIASLGKSGGTLDYVAAWFVLAGAYVRNHEVRIGFVATNSITQGEQVAQLWPLIFERHGLEIHFAHRTFAWGSDARGKAHVHVVIVGLDKRRGEKTKKRLFNYSNVNADPVESEHTTLSPYLTGADTISNPFLTVNAESNPINGFRRLIIGSKPIDGGNYILGESERRELLESEPDAAEFIRPYVGAWEFLQNKQRWIISLHNARPEQIDRMPRIKAMVASVRQFRMKSKSAPTLKLAETPTLYHVNVIPNSAFLVIPKVSSERREYVPIGWLEPPVIPSDLVHVLENASHIEFVLLTSTMHMSWMRNIGGRLESRFRYSIGLVYNTFPAPPGYPDSLNRPTLERAAKSVLKARADFPDASLANLYDPDIMPPKLRQAHNALDREVDKLYKRSGFGSDRERFEHLLALYERMKAPFLQEARKGQRKSGAKSGK